jgi:hypothetical protein
MRDFQSPVHDPENCPGCRPVVFDPDTRKVDVRATLLACKAFDAAKPSQRRAWHRVTCMNSQDFIDVNLAQQLVAEFQREMDDAPAPPPGSATRL